MSDQLKKAAATESPERHGRDLQKVNDKLRELISSLKSDRQRRDASAAASHPTPVPEAGDPADLEKRRLAAELAAAREAIARADLEREELRDRLAEIEAENTRICDDLVAVQEQSSQLAQLYAALERIHGGLSRPETLAAVQEIVINVVGSEEMAVFERRGDDVALAQSFGVDPAQLLGLRVGEGAIGRAVATGKLWVAGLNGEPAPGEENISAIVPLRAGREVVGALVIFRLLGHKPGLDEGDRVMFDLLSAHAGLALRLRRERPS